jgi:hypothetical protein
MLDSLLTFLVAALCIGILGGVVWSFIRRNRVEAATTHDLDKAPRRSMIDPGARGVAFANPGQAGEDAQMSANTIDHRMNELERLKAQGQITKEEYETRIKNMTE